MIGSGYPCVSLQILMKAFQNRFPSGSLARYSHEGFGS